MDFSMWIPPFGNPRLIGYLLLPAAYRSLSRPSSSPSAKAFALRSFELDHAFLNFLFASYARIFVVPSTNIVVTLNNFLLMGFTFLYLFAVFVVQFSRCVFTMTAVCRPRFLSDSSVCTGSSFGAAPAPSVGRFDWGSSV